MKSDSPEVQNSNETDPSGKNSSLGLLATIARRVSCRAYLPDPIPEQDLTQILEAARLALSACNQQPWRFAVVRQPEPRRRIKPLADLVSWL